MSPYFYNFISVVLFLSFSIFLIVRLIRFLRRAFREAGETYRNAKAYKAAKKPQKAKDKPEPQASGQVLQNPEGQKAVIQPDISSR